MRENDVKSWIIFSTSIGDDGRLTKKAYLVAAPDKHQAVEALRIRKNLDVAPDTCREAPIDFVDFWTDGGLKPGEILTLYAVQE
jgi:hypothetical protein